MATQKSRTPWKDPSRAFEDKTLIESGNEIQIVQKIDLELGSYPDPTGSGIYLSETVSYNSYNRTFTMSSSDEAAKFKAGDEIVLYNEDDASRIKKVKNCVKSVTGVYVEVFNDVPAIPGTVIMEKNLVFRGSNVNCYREDMYGVKRFYPAIAGTAEIESSMGEMFEYKWDRSDFTFTMDNYDGRFNPYMPGGELYTSFALREVHVFFGFGEEAHKNKLVFSGVTNLNNGISEDDEKLKITAYDISYLYNIPVALNTFTTNILDPDYHGKPIPVLFGDYTTVGAYVQGVMRPVIPAILTRIITTLQNSQMMINQSELGVSSSIRIKAKSFGTTYDGWQIVLNYSRTEVSGISPSVTVTSLGGGKNKFEVTLYRGKSTGGILYSSTRWIKDCLNSSSTFSSNFTFAGEVNEPVTEYKNYTVPYNNSGSTDAYMKQVTYSTNGGASTKQVYYKISANGLNTSTGAFKFHSNKGSWDEPADWDTTYNTLNNLSTSNIVWNASTGELIFQPDGSLSDDVIQKQKVFVWVAGPQLENTTIKKDDLLLFNVAHSGTSRDYADIDRSGNGATGVYAGTPEPVAGGGFPLGGYRQIRPFSIVHVPGTPRVCDTFLGITISCSGGRAAYDWTKWSWLWWNFNLVEDLGSKNFIFEVEFQKEFNSEPLDNTRVRVPGQTAYLFGMGLRSNQFNDPKITGYFNANSCFVLNFNGSIITTTNVIYSDKVYGIKVYKSGTTVRVYLKNITDGGIYSECTYSGSNTITNVGGDDVNYCVFGSRTVKADAGSGSFFGKIGMTRFRVGETSFLDEDFTVYGSQGVDSDIVSIAKKIIKFSGADEDMFDTSWDNFYKDKVNQAYQARCYIAKDDLKTVDYAVEILGQIGLVLTMREVRGKMRFGLIWDNLPFYQKGVKKLTAYDIEYSSVVVERELNQYFNTAKAEYNYNPAEDELAMATGSYYEPDAVIRDGNLEVWFKREDKGFGSFEFPSIYTLNDASDILKQIIANSTPNTEMITMRLSWRHLMLQVGEFVLLNYGRYKNVPCQVRSVKLDANGSSLEVKLRSMENLNFIDASTGDEYTPPNFDGIGGNQALANITNRTDEGDE